MKSMYCKIPWENVIIDDDGYVSFCCHSKKPIGQISQDGSFMEIWNSELAQDIRKSIVEGKVHENCSAPSCPFNQMRIPMSCFMCRGLEQPYMKDNFVVCDTCMKDKVYRVHRGDNILVYDDNLPFGLTCRIYSIMGRLKQLTGAITHYLGDYKKKYKHFGVNIPTPYLNYNIVDHMRFGRIDYFSYQNISEKDHELYGLQGSVKTVYDYICKNNIKRVFHYGSKLMKSVEKQINKRGVKCSFYDGRSFFGWGLSSKVDYLSLRYIDVSDEFKYFVSSLKKPIALYHIRNSTYKEMVNPPPANYVPIFSKIMDKYDGSLVRLGGVTPYYVSHKEFSKLDSSRFIEGRNFSYDEQLYLMQKSILVADTTSVIQSLAAELGVQNFHYYKVFYNCANIIPDRYYAVWSSNWGVHDLKETEIGFDKCVEGGVHGRFTSNV